MLKSVRHLPHVQQLVESLARSGLSSDGVIRELQRQGISYRRKHMLEDIRLYKKIEVVEERSKYTPKIHREKWEILLVVKTVFTVGGYSQQDFGHLKNLKKSDLQEKIKEYARDTAKKVRGKKIYYELEVYTGKNLEELEGIYSTNDMTVATYRTHTTKGKELCIGVLGLLETYGDALNGNWVDKLAATVEMVPQKAYKNTIREMLG